MSSEYVVATPVLSTLPLKTRILSTLVRFVCQVMPNEIKQICQKVVTCSLFIKNIGFVVISRVIYVRQVINYVTHNCKLVIKKYYRIFLFSCNNFTFFQLMFVCLWFNAVFNSLGHITAVS